MLYGTVVCPVCLKRVFTCGQTVGWIKMPFGKEAGLGPGLPTERGTTPHFSAHVYCGQTAGWIRIALSTEVNLGPGDTILRGDPTPPRKGAQQPPNFSTHV